MELTFPQNHYIIIITLHLPCILSFFISFFFFFLVEKSFVLLKLLCLYAVLKWLWKWSLSPKKTFILLHKWVVFLYFQKLDWNYQNENLYRLKKFTSRSKKTFFWFNVNGYKKGVIYKSFKYLNRKQWKKCFAKQ